MSAFSLFCPKAPDWRLDWPALDEYFSWIRDLRDSPQDPIFHAEGDVWIHVGMVCEALAELKDWRTLPEKDRELVFGAALLHDVAKPACTRTEDGRITSRGHSPRGAIQARRIMWSLGFDFAEREQICSLVRYHQSPFHLINRPDSQRMAFLISLTTRCDLLALLARADALGRKCADQDKLLTQIELFREYCAEQECLNAPRKFPSNHSRFLYFRTPGRDPNYLAHDETTCTATLMSGLPGSGKSTWLDRQGLPQVSLDAIRIELGTGPVGNQGPVLQAAREQARAYLREGRDFAWNATNLNQELRTPLVDLFTSYGAAVRIVYVEAEHDTLFRQNEARTAEVPRQAIDRMMERWEVPSPAEAQEVDLWINRELLIR